MASQGYGFQKSSGECQREHRQETDQRAGGEKDYEQDRSYRSMAPVHARMTLPRASGEATSID
jgi:hypothetical protein